jgi:hypothetical protein
VRLASNNSISRTNVARLRLSLNLIIGSRLAATPDAEKLPPLNAPG